MMTRNMPSLAMVDKSTESDLPPLGDDHGFKPGDRVSMPLFGGVSITGVVTYIDFTIAKKRYKGLAVLGDDKRYYELHPEIAKKV
jgi:hypothetical protein